VNDDARADEVTVDDLSYDTLRYQEPASAAGPLLTGLVLLLVTVVGGPQVWDALRDGDLRPEVVFYPVVGIAFGCLALSRRGR
jgi:hypothetical protein